MENEDRDPNKFQGVFFELPKEHQVGVWNNGRIWVTRDGQYIPIEKMEDSHLHNTILFIQKRLADDPNLNQIGYNVSPRTFLKAMEEERIKRGLPLPLLPFKTLEYRQKETENE